MNHADRVERRERQRHDAAHAAAARRVWTRLALFFVAASARLAHADAQADLRKLVDAEVAWMASGPASHVHNELNQPLSLTDIEAPAGMFAADAPFSLPDSELVHGGAALFSEMSQGCYLAEPKVKDFAAIVSSDGKSAVVSFVVTFGSKVDWKCHAPPAFRASEVLVLGTKWQVVAGAWSLPIDNKAVNDAAADGHLDTVAIAPADGGDASVRSAVDDLLAHGVDRDAAARKNLVVFGSAAGERTTDGKLFAGAWKATWVGHASLAGPVVTGSAGQLGWAFANVVLDKGKYKIPFRTFLVFDQRAAWSLAHVQLAAATARFGYGDGAIGCSPELAARARRRLLKWTRSAVPVGKLVCATGKFYALKTPTTFVYTELEYIGDDDKHQGAAMVLTADGAEIIHVEGYSLRPIPDEAREVIDLDGDGSDEILVRASGYYVIPGRNTESHRIEACGAKLSHERAGKETHVVVEVDKPGVGAKCLPPGRHVFAYDSKRGELTELPVGR